MKRSHHVSEGAECPLSAFSSGRLGRHEAMDGYCSQVETAVKSSEAFRDVTEPAAIASSSPRGSPPGRTRHAKPKLEDVP
jgi:hypothetical protein